jgi:ATP adenylyltransferase
MERLFSPWRSQYIESFSKPAAGDGRCILCDAVQSGDDASQFIVLRGAKCYVIMNRYPYNSGHLMVVPYRHCPSLVDLAPEEASEAMSLLQRMMRVLQAVSNPDGFNVGANIGRTAGAGIDQHVHLHLVPRWNGDTNFMPLIADTKIVSEEMLSTYRKLLAQL